MKTFIRYILSGGLAAAAHFVVLISLVELANVDPVVATTIGFTVAIGVNYAFQYNWTFAASGSHSITFVRYIIVTLVMMAANATVFWLVTMKLEVDYILAQIIATGLITSANFQINRRYTFASTN